MPMFSTRLHPIRKISMNDRMNFRKHRDSLQLYCFTPDENIRPYFLAFERHGNTLVIQPHNISKLFFLDLAETWYTMKLDESMVSFNFSDRQNMNFYSSCLQKHIKHCVVNYFSETIRDSNDPLPSKFVKSFLHYIRITRLCRRNNFSIEVLNRVLQYLRLFHNDSDLVCDLLTTVFSARQQLRTYLFSSSFCPGFLLYILRMCNEARFNIRSFLTLYSSRNGNSVLHFCPVLNCLLLGNEPRLNMLLNHGFSLSKLHLEDIFRMYRYYEDHIGHFFQLPLNDMFFNCHDHRKELLMITLYLLYSEALSDTRTPSPWIRCALLFLRSIPEPYLSRHELAHLLAHENLGHWYRETIMSIYDEHFKGIGSEIYEPRKLQHLSRCCIRRHLSDNFELPIGILSLGLPQKLILYLRLEY